MMTIGISEEIYSISVWGIHVVSPEEENKAVVGRICRKGRF